MKFFTVKLAGHKWELHEVRETHAVFKDLGECYAVTVPEKCRFYFAKGYPQPAYEDSFVHEVFGHGAFTVSGARQRLVDLCDGDCEKAIAIEEDMIRGLVMVWYPLLKDLNFQFPKPAPKVKEQ